MHGTPYDRKAMPTASLMEELEMNHGTKTRHAWALATSLALLSSAPALADGHPDRARLDTNGDGSVDLAEFQAVRPEFTIEKFNAADTNRDGLLSHEEMHAAHGEGHRSQKMDTDGDGNYSFDELQKAHPDLTQEKYASYDADKDGKLTRMELRQGFGREMFSKLDKDASGGVNLVEMQSVRSSVTQEEFARMDTDANGQLSHDEMSAAHRKHRNHDGKAPEAQPNGG